MSGLPMRIYINECRDRPVVSDSGTGVAHCPSSNMRLASGIAPVRQVHRIWRPVLEWVSGVDGSASNDGNHLMGEATAGHVARSTQFVAFA